MITIFTKKALRGMAVGMALALGTGMAQAETLTVATPGVALHFYPFYVAEAAGFFEDEGIEIDWVDVGSGSKQIAAVAGGSVEYAVVGMQPAINARQNGADVVAVAALFNGYPIQLVLSNEALKKTGIDASMSINDKVARLKDVSIAVTGIGSTTDVLLRSYLSARDIDPNQTITIQPLGNPGAIYAAFEQGQIDGFQLGAPHTQMAEQEGLGKTAIDPLDGGIPELENVPYTAIITNGRTVEEKPELLQRSINALAKAMKLTKDDPDRVQDLLKSYFPDIDEAAFKSFEVKYRANSATTPVLSKEAYDKLLSWVAITSDQPITVPYEAFFVGTFADVAAPMAAQ